MAPRRTTSIQRINEVRSQQSALSPQSGAHPALGSDPSRQLRNPVSGLPAPTAPSRRPTPTTPASPATPTVGSPAAGTAPQSRYGTPVRREGQATTAYDANRSRFTRSGAIQSGAASGVQTPTPSSPTYAPPQRSPVTTPVSEFLPGNQFRPGVTVGGGNFPQQGAQQRPQQGASSRPVQLPGGGYLQPKTQPRPQVQPSPTTPAIGQSQAGLQAAPTTEPPPAAEPSTSTPPPVDLGSTFESNESFQAMQAWAAEMQAKGFDSFTDEDWANWERWLTIDRNRPQGWLTPGFGRSDEGIAYEEAENLGGFDSFADLARSLGADEAEIRALTLEGYRFRRGLDDDRIYIQTPNSNSMQLWEAFQTTPVSEEARTRDQEAEELSQVEEFKRYLEELGVTDAPVFDEQAIEDLIASNREANALAEAQNVQAIMERAARAGAAPEAVSGLIADASHASRVAQAQQENQMRLAGAEQNFQAQMAEYQRQYNAAMQLLNMAEDARTREMAQQYAQRMAVLQHELNKQYQQYVFELGAPTSGDIGASVFGALGSLGGSFFGPAGAVAGGAGGSALGALAFG